MVMQVDVVGEVIDMVGEKSEGSELVDVLMIVQVEVVEELMDVIGVVADKQEHKVGDKVTKEVMDMAYTSSKLCEF